MSISAEVGLKIKAYRQKLNRTLKDIESRVDVSATHVSEIERGKTSPTIGALQKMAIAPERELPISSSPSRSTRSGTSALTSAAGTSRPSRGDGPR